MIKTNREDYKKELEEVVYMFSLGDDVSIVHNEENDGYNYCHLNITNMPTGIGIMNTYVIDNNSIGVLIRNFTNEEKVLGILNCKGYIEKLS